ncbi:MAG: nuclear transport factor 2 family protein [Candidatus Izimaplasma sp.]|nr:nuclear transport factor 2 family protein [Candidatus Izimaplasma bacterium]
MTKEQELLNRDRLFSQTVMEKGVEAWALFCAREVIMGTPKHSPYLKEWNNIVPLMKDLYNRPGLSFSWEPSFVFVSEDESLGVTTGMYKRTFVENKKQVTVVGKYVSTWQKIDDEWKVIFDMGN